MFYKNNTFIEISLISLLFIISFSCLLYRYQYLDYKTYTYDEGIIVYGANRILNGDIPYKDFWTLYAPGIFYTIAAIFKIFGTSIKSERLFSITILSLTICAAYFFIRKLYSKIPAFFTSALLIICLRFYIVFNRPAQIALLFFVLCCISFFNFLTSNQKIWLFICGILSGIITIFRQDFGFFCFISLFIAIFFHRLNYYLNIPKDKKSILAIFNAEMSVCLGILLIIFPFMAYLIFNSALIDFIKDAVIFPLSTYPKVRDLPFPRLQLDNLIFYFPILVFSLTGFSIHLYFKNKDNRLWGIFFLLLFSLGIFFYSSLRADIEHFIPTLFLTIVLVFIILNKSLKNRFNLDKNNIQRIITHIFASSIIILFIVPSLIKFNNLPPEQTSKNKLIYTCDRGRGMYFDNSEFSHSQNQAIQYIQKNTKQNEKIFVGNSRHDKLIYNNIMFYFFSERDCATKYHELHPGLITTKEAQKEIINEFKQIYVPYVILWAGAEKMNEPNASSKSNGVLDFDNFIKKNYEIEKKFGSYIILRHI